MGVTRDNVVRAEIDERDEVHALRVLYEASVGVGYAMRCGAECEQRAEARECHAHEPSHVCERSARRRSDVYHAAVDTRGESKNENDSLPDSVARARSWPGAPCAGARTPPAAAPGIARACGRRQSDVPDSRGRGARRRAHERRRLAANSLPTSTARHQKQREG